jgi:DNA-binding XRE family transcriptional regulator
LAAYVLRQRSSLALSQKDVAVKAGIHAQSVGKIERGQTISLNQKTKRGLAYALEISEAYLDAAVKGIAVESTGVLRFCPQCWKPGTPPDSIWLNVRAHYCFICGTALQHSCSECNAVITSLKHRFCPYCGTPYSAKSQN